MNFLKMKKIIKLFQKEKKVKAKVKKKVKKKVEK